MHRIIVVKEVASRVWSRVVERLLQRQEDEVKFNDLIRGQRRRTTPGKHVNDLQPLFDVLLHLQRSEYLSNCDFVEDLYALAVDLVYNSTQIVMRNVAFFE